MTAYHLLGREGARRIAWWRPLVEFVVVLVLFFGIFAAMIALFDAACNPVVPNHAVLKQRPDLS